MDNLVSIRKRDKRDQASVAPVTTGGIVHQCELMRDLCKRAETYARSEAPVLITGKTGTGKELFARLVHEKSQRREGKLVVVNCGSLPESLVEAMFFGSKKGAYTSSVANQVGFFWEADGGTIFLDEIGELPLALQSRLLRILEDKIVVPIGATDGQKSDFRLIVATNRDLEAEVKAGRFRADLYQRLNVLRLFLPSLRARGHLESAKLSWFFLDEFNQKNQRNLVFSDEVQKLIAEYDWPGNVRELKNAIERAFWLCPGEVITADHFELDGSVGDSIECPVELPSALEAAVNAFKKEFVIAMIKKYNGNRTLAAKAMDIQRTYLSRLSKTHGIDNELLNNWTMDRLFKFRINVQGETTDGSAKDVQMEVELKKSLAQSRKLSRLLAGKLAQKSIFAGKLTKMAEKNSLIISCAAKFQLSSLQAEFEKKLQAAIFCTEKRVVAGKVDLADDLLQKNLSVESSESAKNDLQKNPASVEVVGEKKNTASRLNERISVVIEALIKFDGQAKIAWESNPDCFNRIGIKSLSALKNFIGNYKIAKVLKEVKK